MICSTQWTSEGYQDKIDIYVLVLEQSTRVTERNKEAKKISAKILIKSVASYFFSLFELYGQPLSSNTLFSFIYFRKEEILWASRERETSASDYLIVSDSLDGLPNDVLGPESTNTHRCVSLGQGWLPPCFLLQRLLWPQYICHGWPENTENQPPAGVWVHLRGAQDTRAWIELFGIMIILQYFLFQKMEDASQRRRFKEGWR